MTDEKPVLDEIDELIATELDEYGEPLDDYEENRYPKCERCHEDWHGLPSNGCPGSDAPATTQHVVKGTGQRAYLGYMMTEYEGELMQVHLYLDGHGGSIGLLMPIPEDDEIRRRPGLFADLYVFDEVNSTLGIRVLGDDDVNPFMLEPVSYEEPS